jgi:hypothetical protein
MFFGKKKIREKKFIALLIGGAGTRPDHPKADIRRPLLSAVAHVRVRRPNGCLEDLQL